MDQLWMGKETMSKSDDDVHSIVVDMNWALVDGRKRVLR